MYDVGRIAELIAFIVSLIVWHKNRGSFIQWMSPYLLYTFCNEMAGHYLHNVLHKSTTPIYLWSDIIEIVFYTYVFYNLFNKFKYANYIVKVMLVISSVIVGSFLFVFFFVNNYVEYKYRLQIIVGFYLCILSIYYLYNEFINDSLEEFLVKKSGFWIAAGILLFYSADSIVLTLHSMASKNNIYILGLPIHLFFANILSVILYACFSVAMIVWKPTRKI